MDGLHMIVARLSNRDVFVKRQVPIKDNTQHIHVLSHLKIHISD